MAKTRKISITDFSAGMHPTQRSDIPGAASLIANFDIYQDPLKLSPIPSWESWTTEAEKDYGIVALGGRNAGNEEILALGEMNTAWYSEGWTHRVQITPSITSSGAYWAIYDLSVLGSDFWDNVKTDGGDIRAADASTGEPIGLRVLNIDTTAETGHVIMPNAPVDCYLYWGNASASNSIDWNDLDVGGDSFYPLDTNSIDYAGSYNLGSGNGTGSSGSFSAATDGTFVTGHAGSALTAAEGSAGALENGEHGFYGFVFKGTTNPASDHFLVRDTYNGLALVLRSNGTLRAEVDTEDGFRTGTNGSTVITDGNVHHVAVHYANEVLNVWVDGVKTTTNDYTSTNGDIDSNSQAYYTLNTNGNTVELFSYSDANRPDNAVQAEGEMITDNANFWTTGSITARASVTDSYQGTKVYTKQIDGSAWDEKIQNGYPIARSSVSPYPSFIYDTGGEIKFFTVNGQTLFGGTGYLTEMGSSGQDWDDWTADTVRLSNEAIPRLAYPVDKQYYFTRSSAVGRIDSSNITDTSFSPYATPNHMTPYDQYLAIGSDIGSRSFVQLWDMDSNLARALIDFGTGKIRVVGNVYGTLFGVVNNGMDDTELAGGRPSMDIKVWTGGPDGQPWITFPMPSDFDGDFPNAWDQPILNMVEYFSHGMLFWARVKDADDNTIEGLFSIGRNEKNNQFGLSLRYDTSALGEVTFIYRVGNNFLVCHNRDGSVSKVSAVGSYTQNSVWQSVWLEGSGLEHEDQLVSVEVDFEPLAAGQTVTLEQRLPGGAWTTVFTHTETGSIHREATLIEATATDLPAFREIQLRVTSTGGSSAITGVHYVIEELEND